jgi:thioredoxin reductase
VPGEDLIKVMYQLVDAQSYNNRRILIVGGGDSAVEAAIGLARQKGNRVTISYRRDRFLRIKAKNQERIAVMLAKKMIEPLFSSEVVAISEKTVTVKTEERQQEIANDYVFIFIGGDPPFKLLQDVGIAFGGE